MKILLMAVVLSFFLTGCEKRPPPMSNEDIIREEKKCTDGGMDVKEYRDWHERIVYIQCSSKVRK